MPHKPNYKQLLVVAVSVAAASVLPTCGVHDPALPSDGTGGAAGKTSSGAGTAGTTGGGSTAGSDGVGIGGSSFDFGGSSAVVGTGGTNTGAGGSGGALPDGGAAGGVSGSMCGKATLMINDMGHIATNLSDLAVLINGSNATTDQYALAATGGGGHTHLITFNDAQVMTLRNGGSVTVMSTSTEAHSHSVTVTCTKK
jgi:hypothetical protein